METKVINLKKQLPRVKITVNDSCIVCKHDTLFGDYCAYQFNEADKDCLQNLIEVLNQIYETCQI